MSNRKAVTSWFQQGALLNILHILDLYFGPRHWDGNDKILLKKINSFNADIVINTGDSTTDGLEEDGIGIPPQRSASDFRTIFQGPQMIISGSRF